MWGKMLDWIAKAYFWVYCKFFQRPPDEPFTRQADRFERRWPAIAWGVALVVFFATAQLRGWWLFITIPIYLFAWWFLPHITQYQRAHPENVPYKSLSMKAFDWSARRMGIIK